MPADDPHPQAAQVNIPLVRGDRFELAEGARLELVLADRQKLHLGSAASIELVSLARSLDEEGRVTVVRLHHGSLHLQVPRDLTAAESPRVDTSQASLFLEPGGEYLVETGLDGRLSVVVRAGYCELVTADGSSLIRAGEGAEVAPGRSSRVQIASAPGLSELELWADALELEASNSELPWIEADLQYEAAPLAEHGDWVDTAEGAAWKPRVTTGWKPYWNGYWTYAPAGMTWVSNERWGWLPYHYGSWDHHLSFGWVWYPGVSYSPAHVYWYWGSSHVAWGACRLLSSPLPQALRYPAELQLRRPRLLSSALELLQSLGLLSDLLAGSAPSIPLSRRRPHRFSSAPRRLAGRRHHHH